jgi:hypothetical protein
MACIVSHLLLSVLDARMHYDGIMSLLFFMQLDAD